jgi:hypothetical protein
MSLGSPRAKKFPSSSSSLAAAGRISAARSKARTSLPNPNAFRSVYLPTGSRIPVVVPLLDIVSESNPPTDADVTDSLVRANVSRNSTNAADDGEDDELPSESNTADGSTTRYPPSSRMPSSRREGDDRPRERAVASVVAASDEPTRERIQRIESRRFAREFLQFKRSKSERT